MNKKSVEENDNFDYLSHLTNTSKSGEQEIIDIGSDSQSSDDCLVVELVHNSSKDSPKRIANDLKSSKVKNELVEKEVDFEQKDIKYDVKNEVKLKTKDLKPFDFGNKSLNDIKIKTESKPNLLIDSKKMIHKMNDSFDDKSLIDVKPIGIKLETIEDNSVDKESNKIVSKEISVQTEDIISNNLAEKSSSLDSSSFDKCIRDIDREILSAIAKVLTTKKEPNFEYVFKVCNQLKSKYPEFSTRENFLLAINEAKQKKLIRECYSIDGSVLYSGINTGLQYVSFIVKQNSSKNSNISSRNSSVSHVSETNSKDSQIKDQSLVKTIIADDIEKINNNNSLNCKNASQSSLNSNSLFEEDFEDLGNLDDCHDFNDIDMSSSVVFADMEVDPKKLLDFPHDSNTIKDNSMVFKSLPNASVNHKKNKEVVRKRTTLSPTKCDTSDDDYPRIDYENWLTETLPRYSPFIAQKGDRIVYLRDAHNIYIENEIKVLFENYKNFQCTAQHISKALQSDDSIIIATIIDVKFFQIRGIKFSVITLKCTLNEKQIQFNVLYRPNRGICEFLVLEQFYNRSVDMKWKSNDEFRSLWKKSWWIGIIVNKSIFNQKYPNSLFKCFEIKWNTNESGRLSPWDLFPVDQNRLPKNKLNGILTTPEDLLEYNYKPSINKLSIIFNEWPVIEEIDCNKWRSHECKRIYNGIKTIEKNISKSILSAFKNVNHKSVSYPVNLKCIKDRLKYMYYRRYDSIKNDINILRLNSKLYLKKTEFKNADDFIDLILLIVNDLKCVKEEQYIKHIMNYKHLIKAKFESTVNSNHKSFADHSYSLNLSPNKNTQKRSLPSVSSPPRISSIEKISSPQITSSHSNSSLISDNEKERKTVDKKRKIDPKMRSYGDKISDEFLCKVSENERWKEDMFKFIDELFKNEDTLPFREPVDVNQYPNYYIVITDPIDLSTIKSNLNKEKHYMNPKQVREDFRLMFANAKTYTKNPKSLIRLKTKLLCNLCEDRLREIIVDWDRVYAYEQKKKKGMTVRKPINRNGLWGYCAQQYY